MRALVASAAAAIIVLSASHAEARARFKFRSSVPKATTAPAAAQPARSGLAPAVVVGGSAGASRASARDEIPTGSMTPAPSPTIMPTAAAKAKSASRPVLVCAQDKTVGAGMGFCQLN